MYEEYVSFLTFFVFFSPSTGALSFVFFVAFTPSVEFEGALEAVEIGALPGVEAGLGAIAEMSR
jgi:hypothetical protein